MRARTPLPRRRRRYLPAHKLPVRDWGVHVCVRRPARPGMYEVDPGWEPDGDGGLRRAHGGTRHCLRCAIRAHIPVRVLTTTTQTPFHSDKDPAT